VCARTISLARWFDNKGFRSRSREFPERIAPSALYGVPYMTASATDGEKIELTLRGFSPRELNVLAERQCRKHFGECAWRIDEATCIPCMGTLGGRVRLYEAHIVAHGEEAQ
jgi:hypothetical protein